MAFRWIISRIVRLLGQKANSLFYVLMYREIQDEVVKLAEKMDVKVDELSKEIGKRSARESAERHASVLGFVPVNPNKLQPYIETLWYILFGKKMTEYTIEVGDDEQSVTFFLKECPVCAGNEEDQEKYKQLYQAFAGEREGYACMMAGMLEELATIIMRNKNMDIRLEISEHSCFARGDEIMAVSAKVVPAEEYESRKRLNLGITTEIGPEQGSTISSTVQASTRLFEQISDKLQIEKIDEFFEDPVDNVKDRITEFVEKQLHFTPREIIEYFENYEKELFMVIGYLSVHALNELGNVVSQVVKNFLLNKLLDIVISALEHGLETFIPEKILSDNKELVLTMMEGWAPEKSIEEFKKMESKDMFKHVLEGVKLALMDYGAEFQGAKKATWTLLKNSSLVQDGEEPSKEFDVLYEIFQEASLVAGYILAIPIRVSMNQSYEAVKTPVTSMQEIYQSSREHFEKLFDLIEEVQDLDLNLDKIGTRSDVREEIQKKFPRLM
ncbi:MAG: hypothetical protein ACFFCS_10030 [Candidatus Hodarchaeota archaeon]